MPGKGPGKPRPGMGGIPIGGMPGKRIGGGGTPPGAPGGLNIGMPGRGTRPGMMGWLGLNPGGMPIGGIPIGGMPIGAIPIPIPVVGGWYPFSFISWIN